MLENLEVRLQVVAAKITYRQIAQHLGVTPEYISRCMRYELKPEMKARILTAIDELRGGSDGGE